MENGGQIKNKIKLLFQSHIAEPFASKIGDKKGRVFEAHLWAVTNVSMNLRPSNLGANFSFSVVVCEFLA